ncbi:MAG: NUDIX hydrolase [Candidatus Rokubacteria bacterium]|nr:NUDIX hydrolase [Candidatus Rokubacteria bacterium]
MPASDWIDLALSSVGAPAAPALADHDGLAAASPAVAVIPVGDDGRILLVDRHRLDAGPRRWEVPAGAIAPGESVEEAAQRQLLDETGLGADAWIPLGPYRSSSGSGARTFHVMVARGLSQRAEPEDRDRTLALQWFDVRRIRRLVGASQISDRVSLTALCWAFTLADTLALAEGSVDVEPYGAISFSASQPPLPLSS